MGKHNIGKYPKSFEKTKLSEHQKGKYNENYDLSMIKTINDRFDWLNYDNLCLYDVKLDYLNNVKIDLEEVSANIERTKNSI